MDGFLLIDKSAGWTSFDAVNKIKSLAAIESGKPRRKMKVGHSGTLDPLATGLLIVLLGSYTKRQDELMKQDKTYTGEITLGATSDTDDAEGQLTTNDRSGEQPDRARVAEAIKTFIGEQEQTPPQYSAIKVEGRRAYSQARKGKSIKLEPRHVTVHELKILNYRWPRLEFEAQVSSGTYIRSIARDLGQKLGVGGYLSGLRRTHIGQFSVSDALTIEELNKKPINSSLLTSLKP